MAVLWTAPELAARYAPHVEELRDFFALQHLHCGAPEDLIALTARLDASDSFREDLSSMVRVILLREGGSVPRADLLEIVSVAIGGAEIDEAAFDIQQPVQHIFSFLNGVLRKPWNQPPGPDAALSSSPREPEFEPESEAPPIPTPKEARLSPPENEPAGALGHAPAEPAPAPAFVLPESVYSRFTDLDSGTQTFLTAAPDPEPAIARELSPPPPPTPAPAPSAYAGKVVPWPNPILEPAVPPGEAQHNLAPEQFPYPVFNIFFPPPMPASTPPLAAEPHPHPASPPPPPSTLDPEPPSPSFFPALRLPNLKLTAFRIPASPRTPAAQIFSAQLRIVLISGIGATLFVAALMAAAHHSANAVLRTATRSAATPALKPATSPAPTPATNNPPPVAAAPAAAATTAATGAAPIPSPSPSSPHPRHPAHSSRDDGYIAPSWSTPIPAQLAAAGATPGVSSASTTPSVASARSEKPDKPDKPIGPDTALGSSPISPPTRHLSVASGQMAILSAPPPGYPMLARIAHVQGRVVVEAVVDPNGAVSTAHVLSGHRLLRGAALGAVLQRRYRPYRVDGHPVEVSTTITLNFSSQH